MLIAGIQKCSLVDYPGKAAVTLFTPGCNMRCYWCHNFDSLVGGGDETRQPRLDVDGIRAFLEKRRGLISGVVITGGEPTLQAGLREFITTVRDMGFAIKLDTNGSHPDRLAALLEAELLDYVAMDQKAPRGKLVRVTGVRLPYSALAASRDLIMNSGIDYEFRTTVLPELTVADVLEIGESIRGAARYALQQYRPPREAIGAQDERLALPPHEAEFFHECAEKMYGWFGDLRLRGVERVPHRVAQSA